MSIWRSERGQTFRGTGREPSSLHLLSHHPEAPKGFSEQAVLGVLQVGVTGEERLGLLAGFSII